MDLQLALSKPIHKGPHSYGVTVFLNLSPILFPLLPQKKLNQTVKYEMALKETQLVISQSFSFQDNSSPFEIRFEPCNHKSVSLRLFRVTVCFTQTHNFLLVVWCARTSRPICPPQHRGFTLAITEWITSVLLHQSLMGNKNEMHFSGNLD